MESYVDTLGSMQSFTIPALKPKLGLTIELWRCESYQTKINRQLQSHCQDLFEIARNYQNQLRVKNKEILNDALNKDEIKMIFFDF